MICTLVRFSMNEAEINIGLKVIIQERPTMFADICQNPCAMGIIIMTTINRMKRLVDAMPEGQEERAGLVDCEAMLSATFAEWQLATARHDFSIAIIDEALEGLVNLLVYLEDQAVPAQDLMGLVAVVHRQVRAMTLPDAGWARSMPVVTKEVELPFQTATNDATATAA